MGLADIEVSFLGQLNLHAIHIVEMLHRGDHESPARQPLPLAPVDLIRRHEFNPHRVGAFAQASMGAAEASGVQLAVSNTDPGPGAASSVFCRWRRTGAPAKSRRPAIVPVQSGRYNYS